MINSQICLVANILERADTEHSPYPKALLDNDALGQMFKMTFISGAILYNRIIIVMLKNKILSFSYSYSTSPKII